MRLPVVGVVVGLAGAFECDLVLGKLAALLDRRSLGLGIGLRFRRRLRDLAGVGGMNVVDWRDHLSGPPKGRIGGRRGNFRESGAGAVIFGKGYRVFEDK